MKERSLRETAKVWSGDSRDVKVRRANGLSDMLMLVGLGGMPMRAARQFFTSTDRYTDRVGNAQCGAELGTQDPF